MTETNNSSTHAEKFIDGKIAAAQLPDVHINPEDANSTVLNNVKDEKIILVLAKKINEDGSMTLTTEDVLTLPNGYILSVTPENYDGFFGEHEEIDDNESDYDDAEDDYPSDYMTDNDEG